MIDPSRLLASATRLYGADMDRLWGEFAAVPAERVKVLRGGERIEAPAANCSSRTRPATLHITSATSIRRAGSPSSAIPPASVEPADTTSCRRRRHRTSISRFGARAPTRFCHGTRIRCFSRTLAPSMGADYIFSSCSIGWGSGVGLFAGSSLTVQLMMTSGRADSSRRASANCVAS